MTGEMMNLLLNRSNFKEEEEDDQVKGCTHSIYTFRVPSTMAFFDVTILCTVDCIADAANIELYK